MTERLSTLLHEEAAGLAVPPPPTDAVLSLGRGLRRRRRAGQGLAAVAVVAVLGAGFALTGQGPGGDHAVAPAAPSTGPGAVFSLGTTVFYDDGTRHVTIDDKAIKSTYYTSAGLLVRHGDNNASDGGGPQRFSLVTPGGTVQRLSVVTEETVPGVDPSEPYLAYTEVTDGTVQVVVHDVATDEEVARVTVPGDFTWGGWSGPPVALAGDLVYVGADDVTRVVNWRTGVIGITDVVPPGYPDVHGGRTVTSSGGQAQVVDARTGEVLLSVPRDGHGYLTLSPDGRYATLDTGPHSFDVYAVATGSKAGFAGASSYEYGWTPDGGLFTIRAHHVVDCSPDTGACRAPGATVPASGGGVAPDDLRFGNQTFES
ncbi:MAG: hypothetical protein ACXVW4_10855 [Nocardioides sp.]